MTWREMVRLLDMYVSPEAAYACDLLEGAGLRFAIDFGTLNAIHFATDRWLGQCDRERSWQ